MSAHSDPSFLPSTRKSKSKSKYCEPRLPRPADLSKLNPFFTHRLDGSDLHVSVVLGTRPTPSAVECVVEAGHAAACTTVVVCVPKSACFADWMRRLLYAGFTVAKRSSSWVSLQPGCVACVLDLSDRSSSSSEADSAVLTDEGDSDSDSEASDDSWSDDFDE